MNVRYIVDFSDGGDTYGLSKILKGDDVEIYYDRAKVINISFPEVLSLFVAKDAGAIRNLTIRPYSQEELNSKQEFLTFIVARASAKQNVTVISRTFTMAFQVTGVRVISTTDMLYKGADPYFFSYSGCSKDVETDKKKREVELEVVLEPKPNPNPNHNSLTPPAVKPEKKVLTIKREERLVIPDSSLGEEILNCIRRHNINQRIFSELCEVNQTTLSKFINNRKDAYASEVAKNKFRKTIRELDEMAEQPIKAMGV